MVSVATKVRSQKTELFFSDAEEPWQRKLLQGLRIRDWGKLSSKELSGRVGRVLSYRRLGIQTLFHF